MALISDALQKECFSRVYLLYYYCYLLESLNGNYTKEINKGFESSLIEFGSLLQKEAEKEFFDNQWNYSLYRYNFYISNQSIISVRKDSLINAFILRLIDHINKKFKSSHKNEYECFHTLENIERVIDLISKLNNKGESYLEKIDSNIYKRIITNGDKFNIDYLMRLCNSERLKSDVIRSEVSKTYKSFDDKTKLDKYVVDSFSHQYLFDDVLDSRSED